jgi:hypothetical protein
MDIYRKIYFYIYLDDIIVQFYCEQKDNYLRANNYSVYHTLRVDSIYLVSFDPFYDDKRDMFLHREGLDKRTVTI